MRVYWIFVAALNLVTGLFFFSGLSSAKGAPQEAALGAVVAVALIGPYVFGRALEAIIHSGGSAG